MDKVKEIAKKLARNDELRKDIYFGVLGLMVGFIALEVIKDWISSKKEAQDG